LIKSALATTTFRPLAGYGKNGRPTLELVPAERVGDGVIVIGGTPNPANGCASGERVRVDDTGAFEIIERGANVAAHVYSRLPIDNTDLIELRESFEPLHGLVEWQPVPKFVVTTVPISAGFPALERAIETWMKRWGSKFAAACPDCRDRRTPGPPTPPRER
jgi:hypothetical protein